MAKITPDMTACYQSILKREEERRWERLYGSYKPHRQHPGMFYEVRECSEIPQQEVVKFTRWDESKKEDSKLCLCSEILWK